MTKIVNTYLVNFPNTKGHEMCIENEDGSYTILINAKLSAEEQRDAYQHALYHIEHNDFEKPDVQKIEYEAHRNANSRFKAS